MQVSMINIWYFCFHHVFFMIFSIQAKHLTLFLCSIKSQWIIFWRLQFVSPNKYIYSHVAQIILTNILYKAMNINVQMKYILIGESFWFLHQKSCDYTLFWCHLPTVLGRALIAVIVKRQWTNNLKSFL